jgi:hypothetical protein
MNKKINTTKKDNSFSKVILLTSAIFVILFGIFIGLSALRNSEAEIGNLQVAEKVDAHNRPVNPIHIISSKADNIYISGRLAHITSIKAKIEFINVDGGYNQNGYPKTTDINVFPYPNNYFAIKLDQNSCKPCTGSGWKIGKYKVKIYPIDDKNPQKPEINFEIIK